MVTKAQLPALTEIKRKIKSYTVFMGGDVTICIYPLSPVSLFITDFGYIPPPYLGDVIFEWPPKQREIY